MHFERKHLKAVWAMTVVWAAGPALGQGISSSQMRALMDGARPLSFEASDDTPADTELDRGYLADDRSDPEARQLEQANPLASSYGASPGTQWGQYQPPDYEDGLQSVGACCEVCGKGANCPDVWLLSQRAILWHRGRTRAVRTSGLGTFDTLGNFGTAGVLSSRSTVFDVTAGYGATLRRYWRPAPDHRDMYVEATYFGMHTWQAHREANATQLLQSNLNANEAVVYGNLFSPYTDDAGGPLSGIGGFDRADVHRLYYESRVNNVEVNLRWIPRGRADRIVLHPNGRWRRECQPGIYGAYLVGIRYFSLTEQFNFHADGENQVFDRTNGNLLRTEDTFGRYDIDTFNEMLGFQVGLDLKYRRCMWEWGGEAKVGPYINFAGQKSIVRASDPAFGTSFSNDISDREDDVALLGEVSVVGHYHVRPNLTIRASWDMMWAVGVALGPEQLNFQPDPPNHVNTNGVAYYQGISLGFIWTR